jgi:hypothetical protein
LGKQSLFIVRTIRNTQIHCAGRMQSSSVLKQVVHTFTIVLIIIRLYDLLPMHVSYVVYIRMIYFLQ